MPPPEHGEGRPGREAASEVEIHGGGSDLSRVRQDTAARQPRRHTAPAALRRLRPADRARVLDRLAALRELESLARQRGTLAGEVAG